MKQQPPKRKRGGQPKPAHERKSSGLTIRLLAALRQRLEKAAAKSGRSVSEECAFRMQIGFMLESELADFAEIRKGNDDQLKADLVRRGWGKVTDPRYGGAIYIPPGQITIQQGGFVSEEEDRLEDKPASADKAA